MGFLIAILLLTFTACVVIVALAFIGSKIKAHNTPSSGRNNNIDARREAYFRAQQSGLLAEFNNRARILDESVDILCRTNNLDTLNMRYYDALEQANWTKQKIAEGAPLIFKEESCGFEVSLNRMFNNQIVRIASYHFDKYLKDIVILKMEFAKERRKEKIADTLNNCIALLKPHENMTSSRDAIQNLMIEYDL